MKTFARAPEVPGKVLEIFVGDKLFPMTEELGKTWYEAPKETKESDFFNGKEFTSPQQPTADVMIALIKKQRDYLLKETDWTQCVDFPASDEKKKQFQDYRAALREFPKICDLKNPVWPKAPSYP